MSRRPVIGLCAAIEQVRYGAWEEPADMLPHSYSAAVQRAGGMALLLPPDPAVADHPEDVLEAVDGLVLAGGGDIGPASYGEDAWPETTGVNPARDEFEIALARAAVERDMPVLGICRGMQLLNVALGGTLVQHLPEAVGHDHHRSTPGSFDDHEVELRQGSLIARTTGREREPVKSHHHQGVGRIGRGLVVSGHADDGLVEAIEVPDRRFVLGVLWHPEEDEASRVIGALVDEARARTAGAVP
jgi:putative glutamine amidotransferase